MKIAILHETTTVDALVESFAPGLMPDDRERVATALLKANPGLKRRSQLKAGTVLAVPAVAGVELGRSTDIPRMNPVEEVSDQLGHSVEDYGTYLAQRHEQYQGQLQEEATLLESDQFQNVLHMRPDLEPFVPQIKTSVDARSREAAALDQEVQEVVHHLVEILRNL